MTKLTIKTLQRKSVKTKYGDKDKYLITFVEKPNQLIDCFVGGWNGSWEVGTEIEVEQEQWQSREYEGKTYWTLKAPASARFQGVGRGEFDDLKRRVEELWNEVFKEPEIEGWPEKPQEEDDEIKSSDIPF